MCGIIGGFNIDNINLGLDAIQHRGQDHRDIKQIESVSFGHVRLSIMDTSNLSHQPFSVGEITIIFNGAIWNFREIRKYLINTYNIKFNTDGDTEVLAHLLDKEDLSGLDRVQGMFAVAWTKGNDDITIARDRHGEVPLHYSLLENSLFPHFIFASEIKGHRAMGVDYSTINMLSPGSFIRATNTDGIKTEKGLWYDIRQNLKKNLFTDRDSASKHIKNLVEQGSIERTVSAVPVCSLLSGGVDSSVITLAAMNNIPNLVSYIAVHDENSKDLRCAREVAEMLNIELVEVKVEPPTVDDVKDIINTIEMNYKAQIEIAWPCIKLAQRIASDGFKVVLSGEGSDELWASYGMSYHGIEEHGFEEYRLRLFGSQERKNFSRCNKIFMKYGVECRLPFLNTELVETALGMEQDIVWDTKSRPKAVLQDSYVNLLPEEIIKRPKMAFQDGMGIKNEFAKILDKNPKTYYNETYNKIFGV